MSSVVRCGTRDGLCYGQTRLVPDAVSSLERTLDWAGLDYDEGMFFVWLLEFELTGFCRTLESWIGGTVYSGEFVVQGFE